MKILKKPDIALIAGFLAVAAAVWLAINLWPQSGDLVVIRLNGEIYEEVSLGQNKKIEVRSKDGELLNIVEIQNDRVFVAYASCPDKLCEKHSPIDSGTYGIIVCLPNRVSVEIKTNKSSDQIFDTIIG